jgi:hypothetical protein
VEFGINSLLFLVIGALVGGISIRTVGARARLRTSPARAALLARLIDMGDALQAVSAGNLRQRGGWDWALFEETLTRVERQTPEVQRALVTFLVGSGARSDACVAALLAADRLSAAYTYWTRLFPPRDHQAAMFVLSLLQDLSDKVEQAITLLDGS